MRSAVRLSGHIADGQLRCSRVFGAWEVEIRLAWDQEGVRSFGPH
jgi:hypothetical protein